MVEDYDDRSGGTVVPDGKGLSERVEEDGFVWDLDRVLVVGLLWIG